MKKLLLILLCFPLLFSCGDSLEKEITKEMLDNLYIGKGTYDTDTSRYVGEWKDGKRHGQGKYVLYDEWTYEGEWKDGKRNGQGTYSVGLSEYIGEWKDDKKDGQGTFNWSKCCGIIDSGEWKDDKLHGQGTQISLDEYSYVGEFEDGQLHGQGEMEILSKMNKRIVEGGGKKVSKYVGGFAYGKFNGIGTLYYVDGTILRGLFILGEIAKELPNN